MELVFSIALGAVALWAVWKMSRSFRTSGTAAGGFALAAVSAVVQILNISGTLGSNYSLVISILTTLGLIGGFFLAGRRAAARQNDPHTGAAAGLRNR